MRDDELYHGFDKAKQKEYEQYMVNYYGLEAEKKLFESKKRTAKWDQDEWERVKNEGDRIHKALAQAIENGLMPDSPKVQDIIKEHYAMQNQFYDIDKGGYINLTHLYNEHPDFKKHFDVYHTDMLRFITLAIKEFAERNL